jgi:hypothetical protein
MYTHSCPFVLPSFQTLFIGAAEQYAKLTIPHKNTIRRGRTFGELLSDIKEFLLPHRQLLPSSTHAEKIMSKICSCGLKVVQWNLQLAATEGTEGNDRYWEVTASQSGR